MTRIKPYPRPHRNWLATTATSILTAVTDKANALCRMRTPQHKRVRTIAGILTTLIYGLFVWRAFEHALAIETNCLTGYDLWAPVCNDWLVLDIWWTMILCQLVLWGTFFISRRVGQWIERTVIKRGGLTTALLTALVMTSTALGLLILIT